MACMDAVTSVSLRARGPLQRVRSVTGAGLRRRLHPRACSQVLKPCWSEMASLLLPAPSSRETPYKLLDLLPFYGVGALPFPAFSPNLPVFRTEQGETGSKRPASSASHNGLSPVVSGIRGSVDVPEGWRSRERSLPRKMRTLPPKSGFFPTCLCAASF